MYILKIKKLSVETRIGIYEWEQKINQNLKLDIDIKTKYNQHDDQIDNVIDYTEIINTINSHLKNNSFKLIETVAYSTAKIIKNKFKLNSVKITVCKPQTITNAKNVCITLKC
ncbi:dihydroneopterin aldolase [Candidatus Legionella polyplacis]|uniref:7,8-dihydroneopterin aldolase n=1 Tax=Candidatus Legionella polyplacis TaxID=2005262 RepID=A0ABZ2GYY3_9GAMM